MWKSLIKNTIEQEYTGPPAACLCAKNASMKRASGLERRACLRLVKYGQASLEWQLFSHRSRDG
ncbi:hypothetical protein B9K09_21465 [Pseudomonas sp. M30-35]|nr:hypothetical protein B9K09_21465 [Pseudomonas sp. M30-35]